MSKQSINLTDEVYQYLVSVSVKETEVMEKLRQETAKHPYAMMQIAPEQGQFMALLVKMIGAKQIIEIGTYTGYSALCLAQALPEDGRLLACDTNADTTAIAKRYWQEAGLEHKIELRLAPAIQTLDALIDDGKQEQFDFIFIDADKVEYSDYYERSLMLLRSHGVIAIDNVLWSGKPADNSHQDPDSVAIRSFNQKIYNDARVEISLLPIADGLTLALKR